MSAKGPAFPMAAEQLVTLFNGTFAERERTQLVAGGEEPIYLPGCDVFEYHRIIFTRDYFASALHEIAHWCIAGKARRLQKDYGYWYCPDGRTERQQQLFEQVEVKPQALEWIFSVAAGTTFNISADNLNADVGASDVFKSRVFAQVLHYIDQGLSERAQLWVDTLEHFYGIDDALDAIHYNRKTI